MRGKDEEGAGTRRQAAVERDSRGFALTLPVSPAPLELPAGAVLDRYVIIRRIGAGGMGVVYQAHDPELDRKIALKLVHPVRPTGELNRARLLREAQAMAKLSHPSVVPVFDVGTHLDRMFVAMEFVEGPTLATWLRETRPAWRVALAALARAGRGLAAAHAAGVVHRDFKPENVLVAADGRVAVTDFGLAQLARGVPDEPVPVSEPGEPQAPGRLTESGAVMGTPAYMAPEQHLGGVIDARSDQFSFCVALYEAVHGAAPFRCEDETGVPSAMVLMAEVTMGRVQPPPASSKVPGWVRKIILRGLAVEPGDRWPTMDALLNALESVPRRRRRLLAGTAAAAAVLAAGGAFALALARPAASPDSACDGLAAEVEQVWGPGQRDALRASLARSDRPFAADFAARIERRFDDWSRRWRGTRIETCRRVVTGELAADDGRARVNCLDRQLDRVRPRVALLTVNPADDVVDRAVDLADLPEPEDCGALGDGLHMPADPARRAEVEELWRQVDELDTQRVRLRRGFTARATELLARAERLDWPGLSNYARAVAAMAVYADGDCKRALELAASAAVNAQAEGQTDLAGGMWQMRLDCSRELDDMGGMDHALLAARALVRQLPGKISAVRLHASIAAAEESRGNLAAAEESCRSASALAEELPAESPERAKASECLVVIYGRQGKTAEAIAAAQATLAARERALGPKHTDVATDLQNLGVLYSRVGRHREALEVKRRALSIDEAFWGPDHIQTATRLQSVGWALLYVGEMDEAHEVAMRALAIVERTPPQAAGETIIFHLLAARTIRDRDPREAARHYKRAGEVCARAGRQFDWSCVGVYDLHAEALRQRKQCKAALPLYDRSLAVLRGIQGIEPSTEVTIVAGRGLCLTDLGRHREAVVELERALALLPGTASEDDAGGVKYALGRALAAARLDRTRAIELLRAARVHLGKAGPAHEKSVREVDEELRRLGVRP